MVISTIEFAENLAIKAGNVLLEAFYSSKKTPTLKADRSVVTETDVAIDHLITQEIRQQFPNDPLLSEELHPRFPQTEGDFSGAVWIIDPIDGTTNFALGLHVWGVLIARLEKGYPVLAVLNFPLLDELYTAQSKQGAFLNGQLIHVKPPDKEHPYSFFTCCSRTYQRYQVNIPYKTRILGSSAYSLCAIARGVALLGFDATPKIWDFAGAWLLIQEAGGAIETFDGSQPFPLRAGVSYADQTYPLIGGATPELISWGRKRIAPKMI
jgi:myo-inositol-1(or 4)-monophosphatase